MIYGIGIDLVEVLRIQKILDNHYDRFISKAYSAYEIAYCLDKACPAIHFAAKFAAKESFLKALGIGLYMGVNLPDVELANQSNGKPFLKLYNKAKDMLFEARIAGIQVSITHTKTHACAFVILEK